ncbi:Methyltransferase-like protein 25, partial [Geodia barretti]
HFSLYWQGICLERAYLPTIQLFAGLSAGVIPEQWKQELNTSEYFTTTDDILFPTTPSTDPGSLHHFLYTVRSHSIPMERGRCMVSVPDQLAQFGMTPKKSHEVDNFSSYVAQLTSKLNITQVLDVGSGKGYLSQHLSLSQRLCVVGVDAQVSNTLGAHTRNEKVYKAWKSASNPSKPRRDHHQRLPSEGTLAADTFTGKLNLSTLFNEEGSSPADYEMEEGESVKKMDDCRKTSPSFSGSEDEENKTEEGVDKSAHKISQIGLQNSSARRVKDFFVHNQEQHRKSGEISKMQATHNVLQVTPHESTFGKGQKEEEETKHVDLEQAQNSTGVSVAQTDGVSFTPLTQLISLANIGEDDVASESTGQESILEVAERESGGRFVRQGHTCIVGLHTCGNLGGVALRLFLRQPQLRAVCVVGCCYHHITEEKEEKTGCCKDAGFPMSNFLQTHGAFIGRTGRMLACQAASRVSLISSGAALESVFRRAVLQVLLQRDYPDMFATRGKTLVCGENEKSPPIVSRLRPTSAREVGSQLEQSFRRGSGCSVQRV